MVIRRLTQDCARKIAAGEVIERPVSVVKELVENAIDAGSDRIEVRIADGGKGRISVRDDGAGMDEQDLLLSVERHATSKIQRAEDLGSVATLGFRGEALASIAAVSHLRIVTRPVDRESALALTAHGGTVDGIEPAARAYGTTVDVRDLFYNMPAREAFLASPRTEYLRISRLVQTYALAYPRLSWALRHDEKDVFDTPGVDDLLDRIGQVYGTDIARAMIPVEGARGTHRIRGFISHPELKRGNRRDQLFAVNGRAIADRGLSYILANAYRGILRPGRYPIAVLHVELPPGDVDVNVHPRKEEIRFADSRSVFDTLSAALQQALASRRVVGTIPPIDATQTTSQRSTAAPYPADPKQPTAVAEPLSLDLQRAVSQANDEREAEKVRVRGDLRVLGQAHSMYLVVETPDGVEILDQHIAHERVLYEKLHNEFRTAAVVRQLFLLPVRVELPFEAAAILSAHLDDLSQLGIVIEDFGGGTFLFREYPRMLADAQARQGFQELTEALVETLSEHGDPTVELVDRLLAELACAAAIKAGDRIPLAEAQALVEQWIALDDPYHCPHGRPIVFSIPRDELDRRFQRK